MPSATQVGGSSTTLPLLASLSSRPGGKSQAAPPGSETGGSTLAKPATPAARGLHAAGKKQEKKPKKRKGAPEEVSSRKPVAPPKGIKRKAVQPRDPRFDDMSGNLDMDKFQQNYAFLEEYREEELKELKRDVFRVKKKMRRSKSAAAADLQESMSAEIRTRIQQDKQRKHLGEMQTAERSVRREEREKVRTTGKTPYYHKRGAIRKMVAEKRKESKKGSRDKQSERREKKLGSKEKKKLPRRRASE